MNGWDKAFWLLFIAIEASIVGANVFFFSALGVILGFAVVAAGLAKVGESAFHMRASRELSDQKETVKKLTAWLNRQYELTQGIRGIYDHRFHHHDRKRGELQDDIDRKYRELAGKIIDVENRMNLISKALLSHTRSAVAVSVAVPAAPAGRTFPAVWGDIRRMAERSASIFTLSRGVRNAIVSVTGDSIVLRSELTGKERSLRRDDFLHFWSILNDRKRLNFLKDIKDPKLVRLGSIVVSFLARLPYVEHGVKPRMLYLMDADTHELGTLRTSAQRI